MTSSLFGVTMRHTLIVV